MKCINIVVFLIALILAPFSSPSHSSPFPSKQLLSQYKRAMERAIQIVLTNVKPNLNEIEKHLLSKIDITVDINNWNLYGVYAYKRQGQIGINFPISFVIAVGEIDEAVVAAQFLQIPFEKVMDYISYYTDQTKKNIRLRNRNKPMLETKSFYYFTGVSEAKYKELINSEEFVYAFEELRLHSTALIVNHELAHHFNAHLENNVSILTEEIEADRKAIELSLAANYNPLLRIPTPLFFASLEDDTGIYDGTSTHPPSICRAILAVDIGRLELMKDLKFIAFLKKTKQYNNWNKNLSLLKQTIMQDVECPNL